jgi:hypothetical protein
MLWKPNKPPARQEALRGVFVLVSLEDRSAAEQRDELSSLQPIEMHATAPSQGDTIANWRGSIQGLAAMQDFKLANVRSGSGRSLIPGLGSSSS